MKNNNIDEFKKEKDYLICIDSDGCAIDSMDIKHINCFGPCMVTEWNLEAWKEPILKSWNDVNLYTLTRGINRFKGLAAALEEINEKYTKIDGLDEFLKWTNETKELSNESLEINIPKVSNNICLKKALDWSIAVNKSIDNLHEDDKKPFEGVKEGIDKAHEVADIAIVSSANEKAVLDEWNAHKLLDSVDIILTQNVGSKAYCIKRLSEKGYDKDKILMVGDALGDLNAAKDNDVLYYPIMVRREKESWDIFKSEVLNRFTSGEYAGSYEEKCIQAFKENLSK